MKQAIAYAFGGVCDSHLTAKTVQGALAAADYADAVMTRYIVENGSIRDDLLTRQQLRAWVDGCDPLTKDRRGSDISSPAADLVLDATINAPKSFSIAAMLDPELSAAYEDLQDRLRDRIIHLWQSELNGRRGKGGCIREELARVEVVELKHERSRSLDPHKHRHLWLNVKVQGKDGKWSNIDTRVALRFQNVINAEGDLAARTDRAWITALAASGFTLNAQGEIAELEHLVRPLSKRSAQIEANRAAHTQLWREQHRGQEPSRDVLNRIDRWAWAADRPNKPAQIDEGDWADLIRQELTNADPRLDNRRARATVAPVAIADLDLELLAAKAIVDADARSTGTGGRFSLMDVRAGAIRAIAATGVIADRTQLDAVVKAVTADATDTNTVTLLSESNIPAHIKHLMATSTAALKTIVAHHISEISVVEGDDLQREEVVAVANLVEPERGLNAEQVGGASAIAGAARIVCISGAAGTGKTTMLKVAGAALLRRGHKMIIVAPTKKASSVAGREANSPSTSLHQLLHDHGWRWQSNNAGGTDWKRLQPGATDELSGRTYVGPARPIRPGDRIVVDEAGMLDLEAANALLDILMRTGANIALVGDQRQALPVGHSGAMALFWRRASSRVELTSIHRFQDPTWAELTLRVREPHSPEDAIDTATQMIETGHVILTNNDMAAHDALVDGWFEATRDGRSIAIVTATHAEAQRISEDIQARRVRTGAVSAERAVAGQNGQMLGEGDIVQTRRNDATSHVDNRQTWTIKRIADDEIYLEAISDGSDLRKVSRSYAAEYMHLGYASTVYGVQGETTDLSLVGPGVDAAGLYVGLTRGRLHNAVVLATPTTSAARAELTQMMQRPATEETLDKSRDAARRELRRAATISQPVAIPPASRREASTHSGLT